MPKPTDLAVERLTRRFNNAVAAGRIPKAARLDWKVRKMRGKAKPPFRLYAVDFRTGRDLTLEVGSVGFTPLTRDQKRRAQDARWRRMEREADADIAAGRLSGPYRTPEETIAALQKGAGRRRS